MTERAQIAPPTFRELLGLALPMIASQASETMMQFVDRLFLSWFGKLSIAASMSGGLSTFVFTAFFSGIVGYTNAVVAQYYGARRHDRCVETTSQGIYLALIFTPFLFLLIPLVHRLFIVVGHSPEQVALEFSYFRILMFGGVFILLRQTLVGFFLGIGKTRMVMIANLIGMFINIPLNYIFIFGKLGIPALGIRGAAIGTVMGSAIIFFILLWFYLHHEYFRSYGRKNRWKLRSDIMKRLLRFGTPAGSELFLNVFAFNLFVQLMHSMGPDVAAAVTITFNYDMVAFVPMVGLGFAVTSIVGRQMGGGSPEGARRATYLALRVGYSYASIMMILFVFGAGSLVKVFTAGIGEEDQALVQLAKSMLRLAAIYTLADITQLVFAGALRGAGDTKVTMYISVGMHWVLALASVLMIRVFELSPLQMWGFFISFVVVLGVMIFLRFRSGKWEDIKLIEETEVISEIHPPKVVTDSDWM
jgi:MATE family multidrug resistance protein